MADATSLRAVNGYLPVPRTSPRPDPALLDTDELTDPEQATWWRDRLARVCVELDRVNNANVSG